MSESKALTVTHVITTIARGGAENQLLELAQVQILQGHHVRVIYLKGTPELLTDFQEIGASVISLVANRTLIRQLMIMRGLLKDCDRSKSVIHAHLPRAQIFTSLSRPRTPVIASRHDADLFYPGAPKLISKILLRIVDRKIRVWIAISEAVKKSMINSREFVSCSHIRVVHYGLRSKVKPVGASQNQSQRSVLGLEGKFIVGTIGRMVKEKDHQTLLQAFSLFRKKNQNASLVIVGNGPERTNLVKLCSELGITDDVHFIGKVSDVSPYLSIMDVFVLSSVSEGFGLVLLEAMDAGLAIIGADNTAIPEVLGKNTGLLFRTRDPKSLFDQLEKTEDININLRMKSESKKRFLEFSPELMSNRITTVYEEALGEGA